MDEQQSRREDRLLLSVIITFFISGTGSQLGSFLPFLRESYGLSYDFSGFLLSCQSMGNLIAILLVGILPAYLGRRKTILSTAVWMVVGYVIFASGISFQPLLLCSTLMIGFARGGNTNFSNTMVSTLPGDKATRGYNLLHGAFALGALLSPLVLISLSGVLPGVGWRLVAGLVALALVVQVLVYATMELPAEDTVKGVKALDMSFLKVGTFWFGSAMLFFYISTEYAISGWLVTYFQDINVLSADHAQLMSSLFWVVMFAGRMLGAAITGKVSRSLILVVDGVGLCGFFFLMSTSRDPRVIIPALAGVAFFMATIYPTAFAFGSESIRGNDMGCSIMIFVSTIGGILTPALVGLVAESADISAGMAVVAGSTVLLLCSILLSVFSARRGKD